MIRDMSMGDAKFKPGVFVESVQDEAGELVIHVSLENDRIADVELASAAVQTVEFTTSFEEIRERILTANTPHVDAISGATSQSEAVKKAVSKAMLKSSKALAVEEGGDDRAVKSYDVVVVGSGGAGLAAAIQAHDEGARVLIVEKMPTIGGNTIKASAGMNAAETRFQRVKGIVDSKELFFAESLKGGHNKNNPELLRRFVENAPEAIEWLARRGIMLNDITTTGGMSIDRTHRPRDGSAVGGYLISGLVRNISKRGIDVMLDTSVEEILMTNDEVSGVRLLNDEQERIEVQTKSIVVATGGFSANSAMVVKYRPDLAGFVTTNHKGATGGGIALLERIGAGTVDMGEIQIHPTVEQKTSYLISESIRGGGAILVSNAVSASTTKWRPAIKSRRRLSRCRSSTPGSSLTSTYGQKTRRPMNTSPKGSPPSASSPRELAEKLGMDYHAFLATLERYNGFVETQRDEDFGRTTALRAPINEGPFHAIRIAPGVHHTMGGVTINTATAVLNTAQQPIPGAYAAGEVVGGIHGGNRIGGNAVADIIIFGTLAGHQAAIRARG
nr:fumarate reductase flavoprotein subunit [Raoultella sp. NCTC 9187]